MIRLRLNNDPVSADLAIHDFNVVGNYMRLEGKRPAQVFEALIQLDWDWTLEIEHATDEELGQWVPAEITCRIVRAMNKKKTIMIDGEPVSYIEAVDKLAEYVVEHGRFPDIIEDNAISLVLGDGEPLSEEELENSPLAL